MVYVPREGASMELDAGRPVFTFHTGAVYLLSGQVHYHIESGSEPFHYTHGPGSLLGLEQAHLPEGLVQVRVLAPIQARAWTYKGLESYVGKDIQFALAGLLSLSQQQRRLTQELARRHQSPGGAAQQLATLADQNAQAGHQGMAEVYYNRLVGNYPDHDVTSAIREALSQIRQERRGTGPLQISTAPSNLPQDTQLSLYQLAFGGLDGLNRDILERFGRAFEAGSALCTEGDTGDELFLLLKGKVDVSRQGQHLGSLYEGDLVGEMAVLEGQARSATVVAAEETLTLALNREQFQMIFQLHPSWTWRLLQGFSLRLANAYQLLARQNLSQVCS
ncbi:MAG: hypothetical protein CVV27_14605 [Candidatus Melainabacteria bacterium HGW-Melainabacteria-1]|nr:MAG: hypothetical protein CVV27_14605 [Candidatus Melainabacteria bacterium HGW-Melainabacteria-1]